MFFNGEISKEKNSSISSLLKDDFINEEFYDIIIITVDFLEDNSAKNFIEDFQSFTRQKIKQTFILFLTLKEENPNIECLYNQISNKYFDKRNLTAISYVNKDISEITNYISEKISYYNGYGDLYDKNELTAEYLFNILICGISGVGKSSFVNMFQHSKRSREGEGTSVTDKIIRFTHPKYQIGIYDTPGFENEKTVIRVKELLEKYNKILKDERKKINLIIYFIPYSNRIILDMEKTILDYLVTLDCEIIFVINKVVDSLNGDNFLKYEEAFKDTIESEYSKYPNFKYHVIPVNLYPAYKKNKIVGKAFGLDDLFNKIYEIYKDKKIDLKSIDEIDSIPQLFSFLSKNKLYNQFQNKNDFILSLKSKCSKYILKYSKTIIYKMNEEKDIKEMIHKIYSLFYDEDFIDFYNTIIGKKFSEEESEILYNEFFNNLEILKNLNKMKAFYFFKSLHDKETIVIGNYCMKKLEEKFKDDPNIFIKDNKPNLNSIKKCCSSLNEAIDSFQIIAKEFKNVYNILDKKEENTPNLGKDEVEDINDCKLNVNDKSNKDEIKLTEMKETNLKIEDNKIDVEEDKEIEEKNWWKLFF